jgi:hypothetical protein
LGGCCDLIEVSSYLGAVFSESYVAKHSLGRLVKCRVLNFSRVIAAWHGDSDGDTGACGGRLLQGMPAVDQQMGLWCLLVSAGYAHTLTGSSRGADGGSSQRTGPVQFRK